MVVVGSFSDTAAVVVGVNGMAVLYASRKKWKMEYIHDYVRGMNDSVCCVLLFTLQEEGGGVVLYTLFIL